ncbi:MAG: LuxR C-terminal-related transcriptional regulator [Treponema sp.]|nr:LuxR C-terminal-related transcriptional regulator [Treponema sp.]
MHKTRSDTRSPFHFERPRLNSLFMEGVKYPLVLVYAGAGYGKTSAVHDFAGEYKAATTWIQLSERDNIGARFWENLAHSLTNINIPLAKAIGKLGFPDTRDKLNQYMALMYEYVKPKRRIVVFDDFHFIEDPSVIRFIEECMILRMPPGTSIFLVSRSTPAVNIAGLISKDQMFTISENDLRFSESEVAQYFGGLGITLQPDNLREIMQDTGGWAFAINIIAHSYQKAPGYTGYLRSAMKNNIFRLMEIEIWDGISKNLQRFLARLSLIDHLSTDLISLLAEENSDLIAEFERQSAYIRRDSYINAYLIHPLFLEFLATKQYILSQKQKHAAYAIAGDWCNKNGFKIDALSYYEKTGDYKEIVSILMALPAQIPLDIARYAAAIFDRAPKEAFDTVPMLAVTHFRSYICQGLWGKSAEMAEHYEKKFLQFPENDPFRKQSLGGIYYCWGYLRGLMCINDDHYDFDKYFEKFAQCVSKPIDQSKFVNFTPGPWTIVTGSSRKGAPEEFIGALGRSLAHLSHSFNGLVTGEGELAHGELHFFRGDIRAAEPFAAHALEQARGSRQFETAHHALLYLLRIAVSQGDFAKAEQAIKDTKAQLDNEEYPNRFINYDFSLAWYYYIIDLPENFPQWLRENFSSYGHPGFVENFANQIKARFCYMTRRYPPLLSYIQEMKKRESFLFGRVEMLAMEACVHYKMKDKAQAFAALHDAWKAASPNGIIMPFIELGKDMRTLTAAAQKEGGANIPKAWLENINRKSATYAKRQAHIASEYRQANRIDDSIDLSPRENDILTDLSHGLSRSEIADSRGLSINTVKMVINNVYMKLGAEHLADLIRIAAERKLI